jgi:hypothetical protein
MLHINWVAMPRPTGQARFCGAEELIAQMNQTEGRSSLFPCAVGLFTFGE